MLMRITKGREEKKASYGARCPGTGEKVGVSSSEGAMALRRPGVIISLVKLARSWVMSGAPSSLRSNATGVETDETPEMSSLLGVESAWREGSEPQEEEEEEKDDRWKKEEEEKGSFF